MYLFYHTLNLASTYPESLIKIAQVMRLLSSSNFYSNINLVGKLRTVGGRQGGGIKFIINILPSTSPECLIMIAPAGTAVYGWLVKK